MQLIIFDTEFTAWEGSLKRGWSEPWEHRELIQLAAVRVAIDEDYNVSILHSFNELIKPVKNPQLSGYITDLTGISQSMVDEMGVDFSSALSLFYQFSEGGELPCFAWGSDAAILLENCYLYRLTMPVFESGLHNLNRIASDCGLNEAKLCSGELAEHLGLGIVGHNHNALYDVKNIVLALQYWLKNGSLSLGDLQDFNCK